MRGPSGSVPDVRTVRGTCGGGGRGAHLDAKDLFKDVNRVIPCS